MPLSSESWRSSKYDTAARRKILFDTLNNELREQVPFFENASSSLEEYVARCQRFDQVVKSRAADRKQRTIPQVPQAPRPRYTPALPPVSTNPADSLRPGGVAPMDLSAWRQQRSPEYLAAFEERMRKGQCTRCGARNHMRAQCQLQKTPFRHGN
jgi:hypothetical protein